MRELSPAGERIIGEIAGRHGFSVDAVKAMLDAVERGGGTMAQFNHYEFGGGGQWLRGGMIMIGDMFNNQLKGRVDSLCSELSSLLANAPDGGDMFARPSQSQSQGSFYGEGTAIFAPPSQCQSSGNWWPAELGSPSSVGAQNDMRYAYFPDTRRLALSRGGHLEILDTGDHTIYGFGQQQGGGDSITLSSQYGTVPLSSLRRIEARGSNENISPPPSFAPAAATPAAAAPAPMPASEPARPFSPPGDAAGILSLVEKLAELRDKGVLSEDEFTAKKAELLSRL